MLNEELYYIQNVERGYVGNSVQWWKWNSNGYTCDLRAAKKFSESEALELIKDRNKYKMHRCKYVNGIIQHHVDSQDLTKSNLQPHSLDGMYE